MPSVLVTGCSSGIGKALAKEFHSKGYTVIAGARRVDRMEDLAVLGIHVVSLDVTNQESVNAVKKTVEGLLPDGKLDILFNNAGQQYSMPGADISVDDARKCYEVNVFGVMRMVSAFLPMLIAAKGTIVNTGSVSGLLQFPFATVYGSSKAALHQYANGLRLELAPFGVKVVTTYTAAVDSDLADTRPLPKTSLYMPIEDGFELRKHLAKQNGPQPPDVYATRVVKELTRGAPPFFFEGGNWFLMWVLYYLIPRWLSDWILSRRFKLNKLIGRIKKPKAE